MTERKMSEQKANKPKQAPKMVIYKTTPAKAPKSPTQKVILEKSCGVVLFRLEEGKRCYLLLHYPGGHWDFGKGHVEKGEDEIMTARREMEEETGIAKIQLIKDFRHKVDYYYRRERKLYHKDVIFFIGKTSEAMVKISHEHQGYAWLPYDEAFEQLTFDNAKLLLKKVENVLLKSR